MAQQTNLNVAQYWDDWAPSDNYYRVLYKGGKPIQGRELNNTQSILQDQIEQLASKIVKEGDVIIPGEYSLTSPVDYVKISQITQGYRAEDFIGSTITGVVSNVKAKVIFATEVDEDDSITFFVSYNTGGNTNEYATFQESETLESDTANNLTAIVGITGVSRPINSPAMGLGSIFKVSNGSYFVNGFMVRCYEQTIVLEKYSSKPNYTVGFLVNESLITSNEDPSLLDNSQGSSNFSAPGADRLKIDLILTKLTPGSVLPNFVRLCSIIQGNIQGSPNQTIKWDWLYDILAKRTFDESGNYIVDGFSIDLLEYPNTNSYNGLYDEVEPGLFPAVPDSGSTDLLNLDDAESNYVVNTSAGTAYVQGYEVGYLTSVYNFQKKARDTSFHDNNIISTGSGSYFYVSKVHGIPNIQNIISGGTSFAYDDILMYDKFIDGYTGDSVDANGRPVNMGNAPLSTWHIVFNAPIDLILVPSNFTVISSNETSIVAVVPDSTFVGRGASLAGSTVVFSERFTSDAIGILKPRYFSPQERVGGDTSYFAYSSEFKLGNLNSSFFTQIPIDSPVSSNWQVGQVLTGEDSGATAIIEIGSNYKKLIVSNVIGKFEVGEDVNQGSNVGSIIRSSEVIEFIFTESPVSDLSLETAVDVTSLGSTIRLTAAAGEIEVTPISIVPTKRGRKKLLEFPFGGISGSDKKLNYAVTTIPNSIVGYGKLSAELIEYSSASIKSFYSSLSGNDFSADISGQNPIHLDNLLVADSSLFSGQAGKNFVICDNFSGDPSSNLISGDIVNFIDDDGDQQTKVVQFATTPAGFGQLRTPAYIYFTTTLSGKVTNKQINRIRAKKFGRDTQSLLYELPQNYIKTLESAPDSTDIRYTVYRQFFVNTSPNQDSFAVTTSLPNESFIDGNTTDLSVCIVSCEDPDLNGRSLNISSCQVTQSGTKAELFFNQPISLNSEGDPLNGNIVVQVIIPVNVTNAKCKKKIYVPGETINVSLEEASNSVISLRRTDVFKLISVIEVSTGLDITSNYTLDDGQRDNYYDISRINLVAGRPFPTSNILVRYDAFNHENGDFFSVDSYTHELGIGYVNIPVYYPDSSVSSLSESQPPLFYPLRDCIDFRPSVNYGATDSSFIPTISQQSQRNSINFKDSTFGSLTNASVPRLPIFNGNFGCDVEFYLPRVDSLFLDKSGALILKRGISSLNPTIPDNESGAIRLYDLSLPPYTASVNDIFVKKYNYKRYRMSDIAAIEERVKKVEDYVSLSLLEQSTLSTQVRDSVTGLDRFKNGFVVDSFRDHSNGNTLSSEYRNSIDPVNTHLRPPHFTEQVQLQETNQTDSQRRLNGYVKNGSIVTVPYTSIPFANQPFATRWINAQPYNIFTYVGKVYLSPEIDTWQETRVRDVLRVQDNSLFNAMTNLSEELTEMGLGTVWGDWSNTSTGALVRMNGTNRQVIEEITQTRTATSISLNTNTSRVVETNLGDRVLDVQVARTMRSIPVYFAATGLRPNTRVYAFFDGVDVNAYVSPDSPSVLPEDNSSRFIFPINMQSKGFGRPIITDDYGNIQGVFLIPSGLAPVAGSIFSSIDRVQYDANSVSRSFRTGTLDFRLTSSILNDTREELLTTIGAGNFTASGIIQDKQQTILSTRVPTVSFDRVPVRSETRTVLGNIIGDPVAQTFYVDQNNPDGVFLTDIDVFIKSKSKVDGLSVYLTSTEGQVPTDKIIPFSLVTKKPDSILRVTCSLNGLNSYTINSGTTVVGASSGARGVLKNEILFSSSVSDPVRNTSNTVYNVILDNYLNEFIPGEELIPQVSPSAIPNFRIVNDEVFIKKIELTRLGSGYTSATVQISPPNLPGGVPATAIAKISNSGRVYSIDITNNGSGYTSIPSVEILSSDGIGCTAEVRVDNGTDAVYMGVATSDDASAPTKFRFESPVYLLGNTTYAFVIKPENGLDYEIFTCRLGENVIGTQTRVTTQPFLGSMFKSQNASLWTEDQMEDVKFNINRASFVTGQISNVELRNEDLRYEVMDKDPIETNSTLVDPTSTIFGENPKIVKVYKKTSGNMSNDYVSIEGVIGYGESNSINGIPVSEINGLHRVIDADFNTYTIQVETSATSSGKAGGTSAMCTVNRPFEVFSLKSGGIFLKNTSTNIEMRSAGCSGLSKSNSIRNYVLSNPINVPIDISYYSPSMQRVSNRINESEYSGNNNLQNRKSLYTNLYLTTTDEKLSPVIDLERTNAVVSRSLVNYPDQSDNIYGSTSRIITLSTILDSSLLVPGRQITLEGITTGVYISAWSPETRKLKVQGRNVGLITENSTLDSIRTGAETFVPFNPATEIEKISAVVPEYFVSETNEFGSAFSKWISREFRLSNASSGLDIKMSAVIYEPDDILVYYKIRPEGNSSPLRELPWIPFNKTGLPNNFGQISIRNNDITNPSELGPNDIKEIAYSEQEMSLFTAFAVKIVMQTRNSAKVPLIDDIRIIATE